MTVVLCDCGYDIYHLLRLAAVGVGTYVKPTNNQYARNNKNIRYGCCDIITVG